MSQEKLYMMAIMPPPDVTAAIRKVQEEFGNAYQTKEALRRPVHLTLYPPFKETDGAERSLSVPLKKWALAQRPFELLLDGFGAFEKNRVIYVNIANAAPVKQLHKEFVTIVNKLLEPETKPKGFNPHITIGYRDIPEELFPEAMKDMKPRKFESRFVVDAIYLWKHNGKAWQTADKYAFHQEDQMKQSSLF